jgi:hypothetical protein
MDRRFKGVLGFVLGLLSGLLVIVLIAALTNLTSPVWLAQAMIQSTLH